jgi:4-hydroxybenzoyl-CoA reductase subunit beta
MMRLPHFRYRAPRSVAEAAALLAEEPGGAMLLAGGTDLLPNMKRRQQTPRTLVGLRAVAELRSARETRDERAAGAAGLALGAGLTLSDLVRDARVRERYAALWQAAAQVATPHLRSMGTLGGNLCLDTRCNYYNQSYEWRKAIDFCMKKDGETCWVAPGSERCLAVSSTDTAPALAVLGARVRLASAAGEREIAVADLYRNDGIAYLARRPDEILTHVLLDPPDGWRSAYWKLRRRGAFDFPVLSVAAAARLNGAGPSALVRAVRLVLGAVASRPLAADAAAVFLVGKRLDDAVIDEAASLAAQVAKPMDNADFALGWRKRVTRAFVTHALRELRGDDVRDARLRFARVALAPLVPDPGGR